MEKRIEEAINHFYSNNNIIMEHYTDSREECYLSGKDYDTRVAYSSLQKNVGQWIQAFDEQDREYFLKLLENFTYITQKAMCYRMYCLCTALFKKLDKKGINQSEVLFVVRESPGGIKSGAEDIAVNLWSVIRDVPLRKEQILTSFDKVEPQAAEKAKAVVFIDDIIATGFTMRSHIEDFLKKFPDTSGNPPVYYFTGLLASRSGIHYVKNCMAKAGREIHPFFTEMQIIRSAFKGDYIFGKEIVKEVEAIVEQYEDVISAYENTGPDKSFSMGFRRCKLLLAFHYETPNNTLCNFWKETEKNHPVFPRSGYTRLSIKDMKKQKARMKENAYLYESINGGEKHESI